ncbi:NADP-dependent oxidoreductase domain-containing protein [Corynascus novoguineensis]|uniref:NADP-dependent oxidoreductase domain-containing protein n=1 Tax=Corynascus novoguineensis TaxID=1126955 RepID=A0AAN7CZP9_9PEZI|nr:NADP-dependent oxidoreductase domain-containing protein [Corynascus novoguineensis]
MPQINGQDVGATGYGLMGLTWRPDPVPHEQAFEVMRTALENGMNFWNGGEIYGTPDNNSMTLLDAYFAKYPEDADRVVLSIKGGYGPHGPDGSPEGIRRSIDNVLKQLNGRKKLDIFECARRDPTVPMEATFSAMQEYIDKGLLGGISLSEVSASTIHEAVKHAKIVAVEVELSLFSPDVLTNGVAAACAQYGIPLIAYSPIGRGILGGKLRSQADIPVTLHIYPRYWPENFPHNLALFNHVNELAQRKGCTPAQLALAWTRSLSRRPNMPTIIPIPGSTNPTRVRENALEVELTDAEMDAIDEILAKFDVKGERYPETIPMNT